MITIPFRAKEVKAPHVVAYVDLICNPTAVVLNQSDCDQSFLNHR